MLRTHANKNMKQQIRSQALCFEKFTIYRWDPLFIFSLRDICLLIFATFQYRWDPFKIYSTSAQKYSLTKPNVRFVSLMLCVSLCTKLKRVEKHINNILTLDKKTGDRFIERIKSQWSTPYGWLTSLWCL